MDPARITRRQISIGIGASASALAISNRKLRAASFARGLCYMEDFGFQADVVATAAPYVNGNADAYANIVGNSSKGDTLIVPPGFAMIHKPIPALKDYTQIVGRGANSAIVRGFTQNDWDIFLQIGGQDSWARRITFYTCVGCNGAFAIGRNVPNSNESLDHCGLDNIEISSFTPDGVWFGSAILNATNGPPNYGARRLIINDLICGSSKYIGLLLGAVNAVSIKGILLGAGHTIPTWGMWCLGVENNSCNVIDAEGPMNNTILLYHTNASLFRGASIAQVITDNYSSSNTFITGFTTKAPQLAGQNNILYSGTQTYKSG